MKARKRIVAVSSFLSVAFLGVFVRFGLLTQEHPMVAFFSLLLSPCAGGLAVMIVDLTKTEGETARRVFRDSIPFVMLAIAVSTRWEKRTTMALTELVVSVLVFGMLALCSWNFGIKRAAPQVENV